MLWSGIIYRNFIDVPMSEIFNKETQFLNMKKFFARIAVVAFFVVVPVSVYAIEGSSYTVDPASNVFSSHTKVSGTSYIIDGSVDPIAGSSDGTSYTVESGDGFEFYCSDGFVDTGEDCDGDDLNSGTCVTEGFASGSLTCSSSCAYVTSACTAAASSSVGGGVGPHVSVVLPSAGSAQISIPYIAEVIKRRVFSYRNSIVLSGSKDKSTTEVLVNGSSEKVTYPTDSSWKVIVSLSYGLNTFRAKAKNGSETSGESIYALVRRIPGDVTEDGRVDDYDLSKLTLLWGGQDAEGDFNESGKVDDYDFSMMVARWGTVVPMK